MGELSLLTEELLAKIQRIQIRAQHLANASFAGDYRSVFKGRGIEFEEVREYQIGDDVRTIDWNVTARAGRPFIKTFRDERELTVMFVVDVSASSRFGTLTKFKNEVAAEIAALLAYTALRNNDKVGLIIFSDHVEHYSPPKKGRGHIWKIIRDVLSYRSVAKTTNFVVPLEFLNKVLKRRAITFLISDFLGHEDQTVQQTIISTAKHHELIAISVTDPREHHLPAVGYLELEDAETGEFIFINTSDKKLQQSYDQASKLQAKEKKNFFLKHGIDYLALQTNESYFDTITKFFRAREKK